MKAELIPIDGGPPIPITRDITVIGRREYCDIQLDHPSLSKRHCVVVKTDGLLMIRDLATTNGTKVKGQMIRWAALLPNDRITLGKLRFRVHLGPADASVETPPQPKLAPPPPEATIAPTLSRREPALDVDDSKWFDRMGPVDMADRIIDLD